MKATIKTLATCVAAACVLPAVALAGERLSNTVVLGNGFFQGALSAARNTRNRVEFISCSLQGTLGNCYAKNAAGTYVWCGTYNPDHLRIIGTVSSSSFVRVRYQDTICTDVLVENSSSNPPPEQ